MSINLIDVIFDSQKGACVHVERSQGHNKSAPPVLLGLEVKASELAAIRTVREAGSGKKTFETREGVMIAMGEAPYCFKVFQLASF